MPARGACGLAHFLPTSAFALLTRTNFCNLDSTSHFNDQGEDNISGMMLPREEEWMRPSQPTPQRAVESQLSSLGLLDEEHVATFRNALGNLLLTEASESTYAEIFDGLPTLDTWYEFHSWAPRTGNPIVELEHKEVCAGSREKAQKLRSEFDVYILLFPSQVFQMQILSIPEGLVRRTDWFCPSACAINKTPFPGKVNKKANALSS